VQVRSGPQFVRRVDQHLIGAELPALRKRLLPEGVSLRGRCRAMGMDAEDGFGNAVHVMRMVKDLEAAGVSAVEIECGGCFRPASRP
jgi:hypothetical protein